MQNIEIARRLEELADLLEIKGSNPFRIRAYRNAIRTVRGLTRPVAEMLAAGEDVTELQGIGKDLGSHLEELVETGGLELLEEVAREVPRELATLTRLDGVGPKKAKRLWKELEVTTVDGLEEEAKAGRVEALEGFGKKSVEKILRSIEEFRRHRGRFLRTEAAEYLVPLLQRLRKLGVEDEGGPGDPPALIRRLEVAGSFRRGRDTVGDIDLLAVAESGAEQVMEAFTTAPGVERVEMSGETRGSVVLGSGLSVDLRIVPPESWGAALHYFTGSKEHNVEIRARARRRGLRISEYGVFREEGEERVGGATEEEVFEAVDLPWIPPVLRENRGEIQAAERGELPDLVKMEDIRGDLHMHTTWSDGRAGIREMAEACRDRGYEYLAITDHSRAVTVANGLTPERILEQQAELRRVRDEVDGIRILHGCEVDILKDGSLDLPDEVLAELDLVMVAVHSHFGLSREEMTRRVLTALEHPMVHVMAHPTSRLLNRREPIDIDGEALLQAAAENEVALEMNAAPKRLDLDDRLLFRARELGVRITVGSDAHRIAQLDHIPTGLDQARRGWLAARDIVNCLPIGELDAWLGRKHG
ncbi:MAG: DNA polymerase/3'-5' exonuclease PolX [Gemmatimonadota bacterium]